MAGNACIETEHDEKNRMTCEQTRDERSQRGEARASLRQGWHFPASLAACRAYAACVQLAAVPLAEFAKIKLLFDCLLPMIDCGIDDATHCSDG